MSYTNFSRYISEDFVLSHSRHDPINKRKTNVHATTTEYEFLYYNEVNSVYCIEDKTFPIKRGSVVITPPGEPHNFIHVPENIQDRFHIRIDPSLFSSDITSHLPKDLYVLHPGEDSFLAKLFEKIDYYCQNIDDETLLRPILINTVEEIIYNIVLFVKNHGSAANYSTNPIFSKVITYIDQNIHTDISIEKLCKELFVSKSYLHQLFMQRLAKTPKKYILEKKLFLARADIRNGNSPTEIFSKYGFANYSTFYRSYKNILHCSPSEDCKLAKNK